MATSLLPIRLFLRTGRSTGLWLATLPEPVTPEQASVPVTVKALSDMDRVSRDGYVMVKTYTERHGKMDLICVCCGKRCDAANFKMVTASLMYPEKKDDPDVPDASLPDYAVTLAAIVCTEGICHGGGHLTLIREATAHYTPGKVTRTRICSACNICQFADETRAPGMTFKKCGGCFSAYYCSKECQNAVWRLHKVPCKKLQKEMAAAEAGNDVD